MTSIFTLRNITIAVGVLTLVYTVVLTSVLPSDAAGMGDYQSPILAFEFAETSEDLAFLAGEEHASVRAAMDEGNTYDMVYPFLYGGLMALWLLAFARGGSSIAWAGLVGAILIVPADINENMVMLAITEVLGNAENPAPLLPVLVIATWIKWGLIAFASLMLAVHLLGTRWFVGTGLGAVTGLSLLTLWFVKPNPALADTAGLLTGLFLLYLCLSAFRRTGPLVPEVGGE